MQRPVLINSWEAAYFDFTGDTIVDLAKEAASLGIDVYKRQQDYVPSSKLTVFAHQFSSIAGAGPVTGPILEIGRAHV